MSEEDEQKKAKPITLKGFDAIYRALDSKAAHTSFGTLPLSHERTAASFGFGSANKNDGDKIFMSEEMASNLNKGKHSPGPVYDYKDEQKYKSLPRWGFGTDPKMKPIKPRYDYYENDNRFLDDPITSDLTRKGRVLAPKFGTEPRMPVNSFERMPGPQYLPKDRPEKQVAPKFTFGFRRNKGGQDSLVNQVSTTKSVGPGRYMPEMSMNPSTKGNSPKWSLSKAGRAVAGIKTYDKHQTYDTRISVGVQHISKNRTSPSWKFGTASRDISSKAGIFKDGMTGTMKIKMPHSKW